MSDLREAYARLANGTAIELPADDLLAVERAGFVGLKIENGIVRAWKGKDGPCYETGRRATYKGSAAAALDDDQHLLFGTMRLCEKTARVYGLPPYRELVELSAPDPEIPDKTPFDCNTFEEDAAKLAATLKPAPQAVGGEKRSILYPGPFKLLILRDGAILRRGQVLRLPRATAEELMKTDGALEAKEGVEPPNYLARYQKRGALCLLGDFPLDRGRTSFRALDLDAVIDAAEPMRRRLLKLIERGDEYFLLVGSDPADEAGCCPSDDVGRANALVRAGVLEAWTASAEASCPSTVYCFGGELSSKGDPPVFTRNEKLRASVRELITSKKGIPKKLLIRLSLILLLLSGVGLTLWALLRDLRS